MLFNPGDIVRCVNEQGQKVLVKENLYTVDKYHGSFVLVKEFAGGGFVQSRFELVVKAEHVELTKREKERTEIQEHYVNLLEIMDNYPDGAIRNAIRFAANLVQKHLDTL